MRNTPLVTQVAFYYDGIVCSLCSERVRRVISFENWSKPTPKVILVACNDCIGYIQEKLYHDTAKMRKSPRKAPVKREGEQ